MKLYHKMENFSTGNLGQHGPKIAHLFDGLSMPTKKPVLIILCMDCLLPIAEV